MPLGALTTVTGVSGAGKTTLLRVLADQTRRHLNAAGVAANDARNPDAVEEAEELGDGVPIWQLDEGRLAVASASGLEGVNRLVVVNQKPIGRTSRSNLATYTGLFDAVRKLYAAQPEARERRFTASRFSFNLPAGRCPHCLGEGTVSIELLFMPTQTPPCPVCHGARYNPETLQVRYRGVTIADVLAMSVNEARELLADVPIPARILRLLSDIGLGYLPLGQSATTLSGGEAQRIKLVSELYRASRAQPVPARRAHQRPASGRHRPARRPAAAARGRRQHCRDRRPRPAHDRGRRPRHRPGPRSRKRRRTRRRPGHSPRGRAGREQRDGTPPPTPSHPLIRGVVARRRAGLGSFHPPGACTAARR